MKNIAFLLLVWLSACNSIYAQEKQKRIELGLSTAINFSKESISYPDYGGGKEKETGLTGYAFGLTGTFKISKRFFLTSQIAYSKNRSKVDKSTIFADDPTGASLVTLQTIHSYWWIQSPLVVNYKFLSSKNCSWFVGLGASPYWLAKAESKLIYDTQTEHGENTMDITSTIKKVDLFGAAQTGVGFGLKSGGKIIVLFEYHRSLFSLLKKVEPTSTGVFSYAVSYPTINLNVFTLRTCFVY
jgi:hypothetical protein